MAVTDSVFCLLDVSVIYKRETLSVISGVTKCDYWHL